MLTKWQRQIEFWEHICHAGIISGQMRSLSAASSLMGWVGVARRRTHISTLEPFLAPSTGLRCWSVSLYLLFYCLIMFLFKVYLKDLLNVHTLICSSRNRAQSVRSVGVVVDWEFIFKSRPKNTICRKSHHRTKKKKKHMYVRQLCNLFSQAYKPALCLLDLCCVAGLSCSDKCHFLRCDSCNVGDWTLE